jgi:hypothetical protein
VRRKLAIYLAFLNPLRESPKPLLNLCLHCWPWRRATFQPDAALGVSQPLGVRELTFPKPIGGKFGGTCGSRPLQLRQRHRRQGSRAPGPSPRSGSRPLSQRLPERTSRGRLHVPARVRCDSGLRRVEGTLGSGFGIRCSVVPLTPGDLGGFGRSMIGLL